MEDISQLMEGGLSRFHLQAANISLQGFTLNAQALEIISEAEKGGGKVLVHCHEGKSRSVSVCLAYLISQQRLPLSEALAYVKSKRPQAGRGMAQGRRAGQADLVWALGFLDFNDWGSRSLLFWRAISDPHVEAGHFGAFHAPLSVDPNYVSIAISSGAKRRRKPQLFGQDSPKTHQMRLWLKFRTPANPRISIFPWQFSWALLSCPRNFRAPGQISGPADHPLPRSQSSDGPPTRLPPDPKCIPRFSGFAPRIHSPGPQACPPPQIPNPPKFHERTPRPPPPIPKSPAGPAQRGVPAAAAGPRAAAPGPRLGAAGGAAAGQARAQLLALHLQVTRRQPKWPVAEYLIAGLVWQAGRFFVFFFKGNVDPG